MKARVVTKVIINAKPAEVFAYLTELRYHSLWNPHLHGDLANIILGYGSAYHTRSLLFGKSIHSYNRVTEYTRDKLLVICNTTGTLEYCVIYRLKSIAEGSLLSCTSVVSSEGRSFAFAKPILKLLVQRELHTDLQLLKMAVEQKLS